MSNNHIKEGLIILVTYFILHQKHPPNILIKHESFKMTHFKILKQFERVISSICTLWNLQDLHAIQKKNTSLLHYTSLKELDASQKHKPFIGIYDVFVVNMSTSELMSSSNSSSNFA